MSFCIFICHEDMGHLKIFLLPKIFHVILFVRKSKCLMFLTINICLQFIGQFLALYKSFCFVVGCTIKSWLHLNILGS